MVFSALPLALFAFKLLKHFYLYSANVGISFGSSIAAAIAGLSLSHTISLAIIDGFFGKDKPFFRTPKMADGHRFWRALATARDETMLMLAFWIAAWGVYIHVGFDFVDTRVWVNVLIVQSIPYAVTLLMAAISGLPNRRPAPALPAPVTETPADGHAAQEQEEARAPTTRE
jgi:hypothetical protein